MSYHSTIGCKTCGSEERDVRLVTPKFAGDPHARECDDTWHELTKAEMAGDTDEAEAGMPGTSKSDAPLRRTPSAGKSGWEASGDRQPFESSDDLLRAEVEKRIRAAWGYDLNEVVEVAMEMIREEHEKLQGKRAEAAENASEVD